MRGVSRRSPRPKACKRATRYCCERTTGQNRADAYRPASQVLRAGGRFTRRRTGIFSRSRARVRMQKLSVRDLDVRGKRVLVRVDFNVPTEIRGGKIRIIDDTRIRESLATINYLREHGAKTILMSHFGRPKGKPLEKYSLRPIGEYLHSLIHHPVIFSHDAIGDVPKKIIDHMETGDVALLENVRFHLREEANDSNFAKALAELGDLY